MSLPTWLPQGGAQSAERKLWATCFRDVLLLMLLLVVN